MYRKKSRISSSFAKCFETHKEDEGTSKAELIANFKKAFETARISLWNPNPTN